MQERGSVSRSNTAYPKLQEITAFGSLQSLRAAGPRSIVARPSRLRVPVRLATAKNTRRDARELAGEDAQATIK